jgi:enoyl-CoA hydratase/carnithine racemase
MSTETTEQPLEISRSGDIVTLWLNRPAKRNAVTFAMWEQLPSVLEEIAATNVRVLLVRGRGGHFCAGADITGLGRSLADAGTHGGYREVNALAEEALVSFSAPTVAVIEGNCIGGGWQIASACDLRLAASDVLLGITPARLGITYPLGAVERTVGLVGPSTTKRLLFTAELIAADEAKALGFVDYLVGKDQLESRALQLADELSSRSLLTQLATKATVNAITGGDLRVREIMAAYEEIARDSVDLDEGLAAFDERRNASFTWRPRSR